MELAAMISRLEAGAYALAAATSGLTAPEAAWRPAPGQWSALEIACHLLDEEREDFRVRLDITLHRPGEAWPPIDPPGWVVARDYASREIGAVMEAFALERRDSVAWLRGLSGPDWEAAYTHPKLGVFRAGDLMASWCAHDVLHLRQLARRHWLRLLGETAPYDTRYAGTW